MPRPYFAMCLWLHFPGGTPRDLLFANARGLCSYSSVLNLHSVPNLHAETTTIIAVVIVIDRQQQPAIGGSSEDQLSADQKRRARLAIGRANVADERSGTRSWHGLGSDDRSETGDASAFRPY